MTRFGIFKEHWEKGAAIVALSFEAAMAFERHLAEVSLETRFAIVGLTGLMATFLVVEMLCRKPKAASAGFQTEQRKPPATSVSWVLIRIVGILCLVATSIFLLDQTATFHNVRLLQRTDPASPAVGTVEVQPAHTPTNLVINLSTNQGKQVTILYKAPGSWNDQDPVDWRMQNDGPNGVTYFLRGFRSPQVFGCWYRLSAGAEQLDLEVIADPPEVRVVRSPELQRYRRNIWIFGGLLCVAALALWLYRSFWLQLST
jgi:hypothetical protein